MRDDEVRRIVREELALWQAAMQAEADQRAEASRQQAQEFQRRWDAGNADQPGDGPVVRKLKAIMRGDEPSEAA